MDRRYFTSESVTEGHPDKLCDQVSDAVVDEILRHDPAARVACECTASTGLLNIFGEITTSCYVDLQKVARDTVRDIGYTRGKYGFDADTCAVVVSIDEQSPDIAMGVDSALETRAQGGLDIGAGDQGLMFGFACNQTEQFMPLPIELAHALTRRMSQARKSGEVPYMRPDGKSQVTVEYVDGVPTRVDTVVISTQHDPEARMAAALFPAKTRPRWIAAPAMRRDMRRKTLWRLAWQRNANCSWPMPLAWRILFRFVSIRAARPRQRKRTLKMRCAR